MVSMVSMVSMGFGTSSAFANPITLKKAQRLAVTYQVNQLMDPVLVKKGEWAAVQSLKGSKSSKSSSSSSGSSGSSSSSSSNLDGEVLAPYYIFSRGEDKGFVIVSGDDAVPEVLGYTEQGNFDEENMAPFLKWYLDYYRDHIEYAQVNGLPKLVQPNYASTRQDIEPLMETKWGQGWPYNNLCPDLKAGGKCATGCVATAGAQVVYYWRKDLTYETLTAVAAKGEDDDAKATQAFPKGTQLKWDLMQPSYSGSEPEEYCTAVATLVALIGAGAELDYGPSTAGWNSSCIPVYNNVLGMYGGENYTKDWGGTGSMNYTDAAWSKMLYEELLKGHPIHYSGCDNDNGGHSVVCDGYRAKDDYFHINMGWNGGSDGYYTTVTGATSGSWGFTDSWQTATIGTCVKSQNISAEITLPLKVYKGVTNTLTVTLKNNGTLDYTGIYLYGNITGKNPSASATTKYSDEETVLPNDGSEVKISLDFKPTQAKYYVFITDKNKNVIAKAALECEEPVADLSLKGFSVDGSSDWEGDYNVVYNNRATVALTLQNLSSVAYEGTMKADLYASTDGGETFNYKGSRSSKVEIPALSEVRTDMNFYDCTAYSMHTDTLYRVKLNLEDSDIQISGDPAIKDTEVGFVLKDGELEAVDFTDRCLKLQGKWDYNKFNTLAKKTAYKTATCYDLTGVEALGNVPESPVNPNAIFYCNGENGGNVVINGVCSKLSLTAGYDFAPREDFVAEEAEVNIVQQPNKWYLFTAPCDLSVPQGMLARTIDSHNTSGISSKTTDVSTLEAGKTYLLITTSEHNQVLKGVHPSTSSGTEIQGSRVAAVPAANADSAVVGTLVATTTPAGAMLIDFEESQYFQPASEGTAVDALRGYFCAANVKKAFRAYSKITQDPKYNKYGVLIQQAYDVLDEYMALVSESAVKVLQDSISLAEVRYSARELDLTTVTAAMEWLDSAMVVYKSQFDDPYREKDCTAYIQNPSFEESSTSAKGWELGNKSLVSVKQTSNKAYAGVGSDGKYLFYSVTTGTGANKTASTLSQTVSGLPAGVYRLSVKIGTQDEGTVRLSAGGDTVEVGMHKYGKFYLNDVVIDSICVSEGAPLEISVSANECYKVDDFRLTYIAPDPVGIEANSIPVRSEEIGVGSGIYDLAGRRVYGISGNSGISGIIINNGRKEYRR